MADHGGFIQERGNNNRTTETEDQKSTVNRLAVELAMAENQIDVLAQTHRQLQTGNYEGYK